MKIGVQTRGILTRLGIDAGMRAIAEAGFETVDFNTDYELSYGDIVAGHTHSVFDGTEADVAAAMKPFRAAADKYGLTVGQMHAPYPTYVNDATTDAYLQRAMSKCAAACEALGCGHLVVHPAFLQYDQALSPEREWQLNMERYGALIPSLKRYGVTCCLENMFVNYKTGRGGRKIIGACCSDPHEAARYIDELNAMAGEKRFAFCFDTGHALLLGMDAVRTLGILGSRVECLHLHDNNALEDQHLAPYMGVMDWDAVIRGLKAIGYAGNLSFETYNTLNVFDEALLPECLRLICAAGRLFRTRLSEA
ncbi:MAG: sugar phosphate isomerase/epimerase family protein [Clostridia bacterium]|nr:sugar phosphate isomerase/epimerase family protein [Clostridia bacterium]